MSSRPLRIAVVGAGIAGLTVALALRRAGLRCVVYEQTARFTEVGAGVQVAPNATRLLHRLGLADRLRPVAVRPAALRMGRWDDDRTIMRMPLGDECEARYGAPYYTLHRAGLHAALLAPLPHETVRRRRRCVRLVEGDGEVELGFADGGTATADVVVGADGIHSVVRDALAADEPRFSGQIIYRGLVPAERVPLPSGPAEPAVRLWLGPRQHVVAYPVAGGRLVSFGATAPAGEWFGESWSAPGSVDEIAAAYEGWHPVVREMIGAAGAVSRWALHDRDPLARWASRRITVVGDAAHPMLPFLAQGANQAIEDAVVLARCLRDTSPGPEVGTALHRYASIRRPRTEEIQRRSRANSRTLHLDDGSAQRDRDGELAGIAELGSQQWLYGHDAEAEPASTA